jgi:type II restriction enzyme
MGFEETQTPYSSGSQSARAWTESWVSRWLFCPNCSHAKLNQFPANRPVADFFCVSCGEQYELKSQKGPFGRKLLDGAFRTMIERLKSNDNPSLLLLNYDLPRLAVTNVLVIPKHFFVPEIIEERKPLAPTARRAGWIGCNILLDQVPASGKIYLVRDGQPRDREAIITQWRNTLFLREEGTEARGWLIEVMKCVEALGRTEFDLADVYGFERELSDLYPGNQHVRPKIRQQLQKLRDRGYLDFASRGHYRLRVRD